MHPPRKNPIPAPLTPHKKKPAPEREQPAGDDNWDDPGEGTSKGTSGGVLSRRARSRIPVNRQRSLTHPPASKLLKIPKTQDHRRMCEAAVCDTCEQADVAEQHEKGATQEGEQVPLRARAQQDPDWNTPVQERDEEPQGRVRSSTRISRRPSLLTYTANFKKQETSQNTMTMTGPAQRPRH